MESSVEAEEAKEELVEPIQESDELLKDQESRAFSSWVSEEGVDELSELSGAFPLDAFELTEGPVASTPDSFDHDLLSEQKPEDLSAKLDTEDSGEEVETLEAIETDEDEETSIPTLTEAAGDEPPEDTSTPEITDSDGEEEEVEVLEIASEETSKIESESEDNPLFSQKSEEEDDQDEVEAELEIADEADEEEEFLTLEIAESDDEALEQVEEPEASTPETDSIFEYEKTLKNAEPIEDSSGSIFSHISERDSEDSFLDSEDSAEMDLPSENLSALDASLEEIQQDRDAHKKKSSDLSTSSSSIAPEFLFSVPNFDAETSSEEDSKTEEEDEPAVFGNASSLKEETLSAEEEDDDEISSALDIPYEQETSNELPGAIEGETDDSAGDIFSASEHLSEPLNSLSDIIDAEIPSAEPEEVEEANAELLTELPSDEEVSDEEVSDEEVSDEEVSDEEVSDEEVSDEEVSDEEVSDEEVSDEEVTDEEVSAEDTESDDEEEKEETKAESEEDDLDYEESLAFRDLPEGPEEEIHRLEDLADLQSPVSVNEETKEEDED
ncbi:Hypothetical protein PBC10988_0150 [Planctomycetales bacterium 10988]|nr:Hypothetical protein PBC10988_0150 [Planctomycetales bacterium 10988]